MTELADDTRRPPRPWLAAVLSLVQPGLGHLYVWRPRVAVGIWVLTISLTFVLIWAILTVPGFLALATAIVFLVAVLVGIPVHAWQTARSLPGVARPARGPLAVALIIMAGTGILVSARERSWLKTNTAEAFRIPSASMEPTILVGDWLVVAPRKSRPIVRDGLYTFRAGDVQFLKRVVGLAGDTLEMRKGVLVRNGSPVQEPYTQVRGPAFDDASRFAWQTPYLTGAMRIGAYRPTADDWGPLVVAARSTFFLGDNRHESNDSRFMGFVPDSAVVGLPTRIYFSRSADLGIRWGRIGHRFEQAATERSRP